MKEKIERAQVERAQVERAQVERAQVERAQVERAQVERAQGCCPWSPSISRRVLGIKILLRAGACKGDARALHHQPVPALTLTTPCHCSVFSFPTVSH